MACSLSYLNMPKNNRIRVRRFVSREAFDIITEQPNAPLSDQEVLDYLAHHGSTLPWEEVEEITHYKVVENYA